MGERSTYTVTERAGRRVAGRIVSHGDEIELTADEADYELREGTIVPKGRAVPQPGKKSASADRARKEAAEFKAETLAGRTGQQPAAPTAPAVELPAAVSPAAGD